MTKIVITGAGGFLGRCLTRRLGADGLEVVGVSRKGGPGLARVAAYADAPAGDVLVHLAEASDRTWAEAHGPRYEQETRETLEVLLGKGFERVIYVSSAVLYGDQHNSPLRVGDPIYVRDTYTRIKHSSERAVLDRGGMVARMANLYGAGMSAANVLSGILAQLPGSGPIRVRDASPVRDFLWVEDAAEALTAMIERGVPGTFNVGTGCGTSILSLAQTVLKAAAQTGRSVESQSLATRASYLVVDITETTAALGWRPRVALEEGVGVLVRSTWTQERR